MTKIVWKFTTQLKDNILEINHRCRINNLILMLEKKGSPPLSVNVIVYDNDEKIIIWDRLWNTNFWYNTVYIRKDLLKVWKNFIIFMWDWYSDGNEDSIDSIIKFLSNISLSHPKSRIIWNALYYPWYGFLSNKEINLWETIVILIDHFTEIAPIINIDKLWWWDINIYKDELIKILRNIASIYTYISMALFKVPLNKEVKDVLKNENKIEKIIEKIKYSSDYRYLNKNVNTLLYYIKDNYSEYDILENFIEE